MNTNASILNGSVLAINGAITLDSNQITNCVVPVPEATSMTLSLIGGGLLMGIRTFRKRKSAAQQA